MTTTRFAKAVAAVLLSTSIAAPASAASVIYMLNGTFLSTFPTSSTATAQFTGVGDTDKAYLSSSGTTVVPLTSLTAVSDGLTYNFTAPVSFFVTPNSNFSGFASFNGQEFSRGLVRFFGAAPGAFNGYDGVSKLAPIPVRFVTDGSTGPFATDRGSLNVFYAQDLVFSAAVSAVPEPGTWAMMLLGFGAVGAVMRRRNAVKPTVCYA